MRTKPFLYLLVVLIIMSLAACQASTASFEEEQAAVSATVMPSSSPAVETVISSTPILESVSPTPTPEISQERIPAVETPATEYALEFVMPEETATPTSDSPVNESGEPEKEPKAPEAAYPTAVQAWIDQAKEDLAERLAVDVGAIELLSYEDKVWSDSSLGCPKPGMAYLQVLAEGYLIRLSAGETIYDYHGGSGRDPFLCEQPSALELSKTKPAPLDIKQTPTKSVPPPRD